MLPAIVYSQPTDEYTPAGRVDPYERAWCLVVLSKAVNFNSSVSTRMKQPTSSSFLRDGK